MALMDLTGELGQRIRDRRVARDLTQPEAAALLGVSLRTLQSWEAGTTFPRPTHRRALAVFLADEVAA